MNEEDKKRVAIVGGILIFIGMFVLMTEAYAFGIILLIIGVILLVSSQQTNSEKSKKEVLPSDTTITAKTNYHYTYKYDIKQSYNGYEINLRMANGNEKTKYIFSVILVQVFALNGDVKHLPIYTTNIKNTADSDFAFAFFKEGTRSELNNLLLNFNQTELIRATNIGAIKTYGVFSGYVAIINLIEKDNSQKIIEKMEKLDLNITKIISDNEQTYYYGMQKFIELGYVLSKIDNHYSKREKKLIKDFISQYANNDDKANLNDFLLKCETSNQRSIDALIKEIKGSIGATRLVSKGMELLVSISVSDGKIEYKEKEILDKFAKEFDFKEDTLQNLITKYITNNDDFELSLELFGIKENMSLDEKRKKLNFAYTEWNKKIISSNNQTKKKARIVIDYISSERLKMAKEN